MCVCLCLSVCLCVVYLIFEQVILAGLNSVALLLSLAGESTSEAEHSCHSEGGSQGTETGG